MSWTKIGDTAPVSKNTGSKKSNLYLKITPDEKVSGVLVGSPAVFYSKWENGKTSRQEKYTHGYKFRFQSNFAVLENGAWTMKVFEQGKKLYDDIVALVESGYNLEETLVTIHRIGSGLDTKYSIVPSPKPPDAGSIEQIRALTPLKVGIKKQDDQQGGEQQSFHGSQPEDGDLPF